MLNTSLCWLKKRPDSAVGDDDADWLQDVAEEEILRVAAQDVESEVGPDADAAEPTRDGAAAGSQEQASATAAGGAVEAGQRSAKPPVRPIQMGEFLRKL